MIAMAANAPTGRFRRVAWLALGNLAVLLLLVLLFEGCSSLLLFISDFRGEEPLSERRHTQYDPEIGWVSLPNLALPDHYGPGISLHTNSRGFRGSAETADRHAAGERRLICSGDSFTLGFGVSDDQTWCHLLGQLVPGLETINMGQGGYGIGQSYLAYKRNLRDVEHELHIFAFIRDDFNRMGKSEFLGYGKPRVAMEGGSLVVRNVPVPRGAYRLPWLTRNLPALQQIDTVQMVVRLRSALGWSPARESGGLSSSSREEMARVMRHIFLDLRRLAEERSSRLVLVFLPNKFDYRGREGALWVDFVRSQAAAAGVPFVDLITDFRSLSQQSMRQLFIKPGELAAPYADDHYNPRGNRYVAEALLRKLSAIPEVAGALRLPTAAAEFPPISNEATR